ncbi:hypothetical protein WA171_003731 [Blastocystis sp. BT1]
MKSGGYYPFGESFEIVSGSSTLFTSPRCSKQHQEYVYEVCLNASSNHIYTLIMKDSNSRGWDGGGWISMNDINDNTIFKNIMSCGVSEESYLFALYSPINKNGNWRYSDSYHSLWNTNSFNDNQWISIILGSSSITSYNTQYFRKSFNGITGMASIDIQFYYSHGIIAYINGIEVFRDNMPDGTIDNSTLATNSYSYSSYRGIILPAFYAQFNQSVISVELHFTSVNERTIDFNSFISYQSGISTDNPCSVYPHSISASGTLNDLSGAFDYQWNYVTFIRRSSLPRYVIGSFGTIIPLINSIRLYTGSAPSESPSSFIVSGSDSDSSWTTLLTQSGQTYNRYSWKQWSLNSPSQFKSIKFTVNSVQSTEFASIHELQFMTCNRDATLLPQSSYSFFINDSFSLTIDMNGITNCMITPPLPQGLILNPSSCSISGYLSSYSSLYTITAVSGSFIVARPISIDIIHLISYPQTNLTLGQGLSFSITPNLTKVSTISIVSGSLPIGLSINPSTGVISGSPSQLLSSQSVTIEAMSGTAIETVVLSFTVITPISSFSYSQSSYVLSRDDPVSIIPTVNGDNLSFSIISGSLPIGLSINSTTGMISGTPSSTFPSTSITIQASNQLGFIQTQLSFTVNALSTLTIILISLSILIILIILIIILIILSKKKKHILPKKSIEEVKSVENRIPNPSHSV